MIEIKTIKGRTDRKNFDEELAKYLNDGWEVLQITHGYEPSIIFCVATLKRELVK